MSYARFWEAVSFKIRIFMILSHDTIMKPPYDITNAILKLLTAIAERLGEVNSAHLHRPSPELRKRNRVKTIKASLEIEGNTLNEAQITAIIDRKRVIGPEKDIREVVNAIKVYDQINSFSPSSLNSFLKAHRILMDGLMDNPGQLRTRPVGIFKGEQVAHLAPPAENLDHLMRDLFQYVQKSDDHLFIKSSVAHYEIEFIHPFMDGNGRMGRLWQTLILLQEYPVFEFLPFETVIKNRQQTYYDVLEYCDKQGNSTRFIEFMLDAIHTSLEELLKVQNQQLDPQERMTYFLTVFKGNQFSRQDYLRVFRDISPATASRDLKLAVEQNRIQKKGDKRTTKYTRV